MTVEIWSDIACPFCYIGKRRFEGALERFEGKENVKIVWRSFQLDPELETDPNIPAADSLAAKKGWSKAQAEQAMRYTTEMASGEGLSYRFDRLVVANTFDAHRLAHLAGQFGKQNEAEERLFNAYFCEGKNIADHETLLEIGVALGLDAENVKETLASEAFAEAVLQDIHTAQQLQIRGVPFFVFDRKYAVSGAQEGDMFLQAFRQADV